VVLVAGPDGSGKTTLVQGLARTVFAGCPVLLVHHRRGIGLLPRRQPQGDTTQPHRHAPYPTVVSLAKTVYLFFDFLVGWLATIRPAVRSGTWVILQRDWWDLLVDPLRYRLRPIPRLGRFLGRLLPRPDLTLVLEADADVILARKAELPAAELSRQRAAWRELFPAGRRAVYLDAGRPAGEVLRRAAVAIGDRISEQGGSRHAVGWAALPSAHEPRWLLPRGSASVARAGLGVYHPVTLRARVGWEAARTLASLGGFRMLPRGPAPSGELRAVIDRYVPPGGALATARTNHAGRSIALIMAADGSDVAVAKIAAREEARSALLREAANLERLGGLLPPPLSAPKILDRREDVLVLEAVAWRARWRPWHVPEEVAFALGAFFRYGSETGDRHGVGLSHGDVAPWNLLQTSDGWVLIDWEDAQEMQAPFYDLLHFLVQAHALLGRPSRRALLRGMLRQEGWIGAAVAAYARGARISVDAAVPNLLLYLHESIQRIDGSAPDGRIGIAARQRLLQELSRHLVSDKEPDPCARNGF
jgi:thymidylate kinase